LAEHKYSLIPLLPIFITIIEKTSNAHYCQARRPTFTEPMPPTAAKQAAIELEESCIGLGEYIIGFRMLRKARLGDKR